MPALGAVAVEGEGEGSLRRGSLATPSAGPPVLHKEVSDDQERVAA